MKKSDTATLISGCLCLLSANHALTCSVALLVNCSRNVSNEEPCARNNKILISVLYLSINCTYSFTQSLK